MAKLSRRPMPILLGSDFEHIMSEATIVEEPRKTVVTITVEGRNAEILAGFTTATEPIALSFTAIPVQPRKPHNKEN